jgi:hypothetical protein
VNLNEYDLTSGVVKVNDRFQFLYLLASFINRFVLYGFLREDIVQSRTLRPAEAFTSTCLFPTLFYYSSCSPVCCVFAMVLGVSGASFGNRYGIAGSCYYYLTAFDVLEGVIWLAIATAAELPQAVSLASIIVVLALFLLFAI